MGWLDTLKDSITSAASSVVAKFSNDDGERAIADLNRVVSILVGLRVDPRFVQKDPQFRSIYAKHYTNVRLLLEAICERDAAWRILIPNDVDLGDIRCVQLVTREQWHAKVQKVGNNVTVNGLQGLGILPVIPIVIAVVAVAVGAVGTSYLLTSEGRQRMDAAKQSGDTAAALARAAADGKLTATEAKALIDALPKAPEAGGGLFDDVGKVAVIGGLGLVGLIFAANKLGQSGGGITLRMPGVAVNGLGSANASGLKKSIKKQDGEYIVTIKRGRKVVNGPYFTDDRDDARGTADAMLQESVRHGS